MNILLNFVFGIGSCRLFKVILHEALGLIFVSFIGLTIFFGSIGITPTWGEYYFYPLRGALNLRGPFHTG